MKHRARSIAIGATPPTRRPRQRRKASRGWKRPAHNKPDGPETTYDIIDTRVAETGERENEHGAAVGKNEKCRTARAFWSAFSAAFSYYEGGYEWPKKPYPDEATIDPFVTPMHKVLGQTIFDLARNLASGSIPPIVADVQARGRHKLSPKERDVMRIAVQYVLLVKERRIKDRNPIAHVREVYGVSDGTVRRWINTFGNPYQGSIHRRAREFPQRLLSAGEWYRTHGRGEASVRTRHARK